MLVWLGKIFQKSDFRGAALHRVGSSRGAWGYCQVREGSGFLLQAEMGGPLAPCDFAVPQRTARRRASAPLSHGAGHSPWRAGASRRPPSSVALSRSRQKPLRAMLSARPRAQSPRAWRTSGPTRLLGAESWEHRQPAASPAGHATAHAPEGVATAAESSWAPAGQAGQGHFPRGPSSATGCTASCSRQRPWVLLPALSAPVYRVTLGEIPCPL